MARCANKEPIRHQLIGVNVHHDPVSAPKTKRMMAAGELVRSDDPPQHADALDCNSNCRLAQAGLERSIHVQFLPLEVSRGAESWGFCRM